MTKKLKYKNGKEIILSKDLIYENDKSFDKILNKNECIKKTNLINLKTKNHKKASNKLLFRNIIDFCWIKNQGSATDNEEKEIIKKLFKNIKYENLIKFILNEENNKKLNAKVIKNQKNNA